MGPRKICQYICPGVPAIAECKTRIRWRLCFPLLQGESQERRAGCARHQSNRAIFKLGGFFMRNRNLQTIVCLSFVLLTASLASAAKPGDLVRLPGHVLSALAGATPVESKSTSTAEEPLTLTLVLKRDDQTGFERYLHEVYDPQSPGYRKFLTQSELSERFGPSRKAYDDVLNYLQNNGFTLVE